MSSLQPLWTASLLPVHSFFQFFAASSVFASSLSGESEAFQNFHLLASSSYARSGYQAIINALICTIEFSELLVGLDQLKSTYSFITQENLPIGEQFVTDPTPFLDSPPIVDQLEVVVTKYFEELLVASETFQISKAISNTQSGIISDALSQIITLHFEEHLLGSDTLSASKVNPIFPQNTYSGIIIKITEMDIYFFGIKPEVAIYGNNSASIQIPILQNTLVPVTNATSVDNPFQPTLVIGGQVIYQGGSNPAPTQLTGTSLYFNYLNAGITGINLCDLYNFNLSLDYNGGSFSITSLTPLGASDNFSPTIGNLGQQIQLFGLNAAITESGITKSNSAIGYTTGGTFGNLELHRAFGFLTAPTRYGAGFQTLQLPTVTGRTFMSQMAQIIVRAVNSASNIVARDSLTLTWAVQDALYYNTLTESGLTGLQALQQLASRCAGTVRWDGNNHYIVAYPDVCFGNWVVPDCHLIAAGGLSYEKYYDLETGLTGIGTMYVPYGNQYNSGTNTLNGGSPTGGGLVQNQIAKITKALGPNDPPLIYDLPADYAAVYIQILVAPGGDTSGSNNIDTINYVTQDPTQWFQFDVAGLKGRTGLNTAYIFQTDVGGVPISQVKIDNNVFPAGNTSVANNNFTMSLAVTRTGLGGAFAQAQAETLSYQDALVAYNVQNFKFVKTYSGTINCLFFGSIPLPGMCASATVDGLTVKGVIESVQLTYPGFLTVQVAQYIRLDMIKPPLNYNSTSGGFNPKPGIGSG